MPSEVANVFEKLPTMFQKGSVKKARTYYFSLDDDEKWTVALAGPYASQAGKSRDADGFFKASKPMFPPSVAARHALRNYHGSSEHNPSCEGILRAFKK